METNSPHESMIDHLRNQIARAKFCHSKDQPLQIEILSLCIADHVQLICATAFPPEALTKLTVEISALLESATLFGSTAKEQCFSSIVESLRKLQENFVFRLRKRANLPNPKFLHPEILRLLKRAGEAPA